MNDLAAILSRVSPLPFAVDRKFFDGVTKKQFKICRDKCTAQDCLTLRGKPYGHYVCSKGFSCYPVSIGEQHFVFNGLISVEKNRSLSGERRSQYRENSITEASVLAAIDNIKGAFRVYLEASNEGAKDSVAFFHDIRTSVGVVLSWCQKLIAESPGVTFEEKLAKADRQLYNLFGAINLLQEQLDLADIIANPSAITYGHQRPSSLTGFWYRMVKLFEPRAEQKEISIKFISHGNEVAVEAFNSLQFLPLILLDNAIKYSFRNKTIFVELTSLGDDYAISVSSFGKTVPPEYREKIFEKNVRGPNGIEENPEGMGMGLFIASQIINAHGFRLSYEPPNPEVPVGNNKFVVSIPAAAANPKNFRRSR